MPRYDYECPECEIVAEIFHPIGEDAVRPCPQCNFLMRKKLSAPAIHFKGSGWGGSGQPKRMFRTTSNAVTENGKVEKEQKTEEIGAASDAVKRDSSLFDK